MKILVTGKQGQLARALAERSITAPALDVRFIGRPEVDMSVPGAMARAIVTAKPDVVINAAAYTAVDQAEDETALAMRINADAAGEAAAAARSVGAAIIQLSTDYVFDGQQAGAYREDDPTNPVGVYGRSKLAGEDQVRAANPDHLIVRTAWVYSPWGRNFVTTMLRLAEQRDEVSVVADQVGSPTSALDLADSLLAVVKLAREEGRLGRVYHLAGSGRCSWADFAEEIFRLSGALGGPTARVARIGTADYPTRAARPANSQLDSSAFARDFRLPLPEWNQSLSVVIARLNSDSSRG